MAENKYELTFQMSTSCDGVRIILRMGQPKWDLTENKISREELDEKNIFGCMLEINKGTDKAKTFKMQDNILRLLGKLVPHNGKPMYPNDPIAGLKVDDMVEWIKVAKRIAMPILLERDADRRTVGLNKLKDQYGPEYFGPIEESIAQAGGYLCLDHCTIADLEFVGFFSFIAKTDDTKFVLEPFPKIKELFEKLDTDELIDDARMYAGTKR